jgi:hypothetical protein
MTDFFETEMDSIRDGMKLTPEEQLERKIDGIIRELDDLIGLAVDPKTADLVRGQKILIGLVTTRVNLLGSFLLARRPTGLRMIKNA